jgi:long-chain acyl-CoA synthetase
LRAEEVSTLSITDSTHRERASQRSLHVETLDRMVAGAAARPGVAIRFPRGGTWHEWTYRELGDRARRLALGLAARGFGRGDRVALLGETRPEWTLVDCAVLCAGATVVPVYQTSSPDEVAHVLADSGAGLVVVEDADQMAKVDAVRDRCPQLREVISIDRVDGVISLEQVERLAADRDPAEADALGRDVSAEDVATIVYTSGTTGPPKGCLLTHRNLLSTMSMYEQRLELGGDVVIFLFLPLAHVLARLTQLVALDIGGTLAFWSGDSTKLIDDLAHAAPTHIPSVPRVFEKVHTRALAGVEEASPVRRLVFRWALATGRAQRRAQRRGRVNPLLAAGHRLADRLVLSRVRTLFGPRIELALTGAAPIAREVLEFFDACGVLVLEGYGMTESCAAATLNTEREVRFGTVGRALPGTDVRIAADGEVLLRGPNVFAGYNGKPEATAETVDEDGWLHTGDLGEVDNDGFLRLTGRKKELIITSSGKNVSPANIEAALRDSRWLSQAVVYGDRRPYLVALLTLDPDEAPALAAEVGVAPDVATMARDPRVHAALAAEVDAVNARFARIEQIKRFAVLEHDLSHDAGELTPTQKLRRADVYRRYADRFAGLYAEEPPSG